MIYDISPVITDDLAVWPGDTPSRREILLDMHRGDHLTLSSWRSTVHAGSHADAPSHYGKNAPTMEQVELGRYLGPCQVIRVRVGRGERVRPKDIERPITDERVLLKTGTFPDPTQFNEDYAGLDPDLIEWLAHRGVRLVGVDTPSVDVFTSKDLPAHHACLTGDILILEGLVLADVPEGRYELIALPLRLSGFDASPVRAVLRPL